MCDRERVPCFRARVLPDLLELGGSSCPAGGCSKDLKGAGSSADHLLKAAGIESEAVMHHTSYSDYRSSIWVAKHTYAEPDERTTMGMSVAQVAHLSSLLTSMTIMSRGHTYVQDC